MNIKLKNIITEIRNFFLLILVMVFLSFPGKTQVNKVLDNISNYQKTTLKNGITIIHIDNPLNSDIYCNFYFDIPTSLNQAEQITNKITINALPQGADTIKTSIFKNILSKAGIFIESKDFYLEGITSSNTYDSVIYYISKVLKYPRFDEETIQKEKTVLSGEIKNKSPEYKYRFDTYKHFFYTKSDKIPNLNFDNINKISIENNYKEKFKNAKKYFVVIADLPFDTVVSKAEKYFSDIPKCTKFKTQNPPKHKTDIIKCFLTDTLTDKKLLNISVISKINSKINSKNYHTYKIIDKILINNNSGRFYSTSIVKNKAKSCKLTINNSAEIPYIYTFVTAENGKGEKLSMLTKETIDNMTDTLVFEGEIEYAINTETDKFFKSLDKFDKIAQLLIEIQKYKLPADYFKNHTTALKNTTEEDILKQSNQMFSDNKYMIIIRGTDSDTLYNELIKLSENFEIEIYDNNILKETLEKGFDAKVVTDKFLKTVNAKKKHKGQVLEISGFYKFDKDSAKISKTIKRKGVKYLATTYLYPQKKIKKLHEKQIYDGKKGIEITNDYKIELSENKLAELKTASYQYEEIGFGKDSVEIELLGRFKYDDKLTYKIKVEYTNGKIFYNYYNINSGLKIAQEQIIDKKVVKTVKFYDYTEIPNSDGIIIPYRKLIFTKNYNAIFEITKTKSKEKIDDKEFEIENK